MANVGIYEMTDTWTQSGTEYTSIKMTVTDTASAPASSVVDLVVDDTSMFKISKDGSMTLSGGDLYWDAANQRLGIGTDTPEAELTIYTQGTNNVRSVSGFHFDNNTAFSQFKFIGARARGSRGNPQAVLADDTLVSFNARGHTGSGWSNTVGGFYVYAAGNWSPSSTPTFITMRGVSSGTTVSEWARLNGTGLSVGVGSAPTAALHAAASTTARASLRLAHGTAPSAPNDGDIWSTSSGLFVRVNGVTYRLAQTEPAKGALLLE